MQLSNLKPKTARPKHKRVGRGGKRGTTSGHGTKGQKSRFASKCKHCFPPPSLSMLPFKSLSATESR